MERATHAPDVIRQVVLLMALVAACLTPPDLVLEAGRAEIRGVHADAISDATRAENALGSVDVAAEADGGKPSSGWWRRAWSRGGSWEVVDRHPPPIVEGRPRAPWDRRRDIRRIRPAMDLGPSESDGRSG